jgi:hypothetical protein
VEPEPEQQEPELFALLEPNCIPVSGTGLHSGSGSGSDMKWNDESQKVKKSKRDRQI